MNGRMIIPLVAMSAAMALSACTPRVKVDPIEVKTIHIVHDINIKVDRELDEFFAFQERATTQPATTAATTQTTTAQDSGGVQ